MRPLPQNVPRAPETTATCVIGMHRSGTSMVARILSLCGVYFGRPDQLLPPNRVVNPLDFFEDPRIVREVNDALLMRLSGAWDDPPRLADGWQRDATLGDVTRRAKLCLQRLSGHTHWGWKDPRTTLLLPFWKSIVPHMRFVICLRNPLDVAESLLKRDSIPTDKGLRLWFQYTRAAILHTAVDQRCFTDYDNYFDDPGTEIGRLLEFCGLQGRVPSAVLDHAAYSELRHHRTGLETLLQSGDVPVDYKLLYLALRNLTGWPKNKGSDDRTQAAQRKFESIQACLSMLDSPDAAPSPEIVSLLSSARIEGSPQEHTDGPRQSKTVDATRMRSRPGGRNPSRSGHGLVFPCFDEPLVSIVIPTFNRAQYLSACLRSVLHFTDVAYELIVVDDKSDDSTAAVLQTLRNVHVVRNRTRLDFLRSANAGVRLATAPYIALLNNDVIVRRNWLSALVDTIERYPECGGVGAKLINMDGTLQEAGTIVWPDGAVTAYGGGDDVFHPAYNYVREVDYCSAACLLVRTALFRQIGGFDDRYAPAYYEDVDLCIGIQSLGYKVVFQPDSAVFHHATGSRKVAEAEALCRSNRSKFCKKWAETLTRRRSPTAMLARDRRPGVRVLVIDNMRSAEPRPNPISSLLRTLVDQGFVITFVPEDEPGPESEVQALRQSGVEVFSRGFSTLEALLQSRAGYYEEIVVSRSSTRSDLLDLVRRAFPRAEIMDEREAALRLRDPEIADKRQPADSDSRAGGR